jgi:hypothetical protein
LTTHEKYNGSEQIHTASGQGMKIEHIGNSVITTPVRPLYLKNILHVPQATKSLISAHCLAIDNYAFLEIHPKYFFIKDRVTKSILLKGWRHSGLYPLPSESNKYAFGVAPSFARWHGRLGHPSTPIVSRVIKGNKLPCLDESKAESVCDACQQAKSHQLPYNKSFSVSHHPLELIHFNVWGSAPESIGRKKYYVSFIDDCSKFMWLYLIKHKSEVFHVFQQFQTLVERQFDRKLITVQTD